MIFRFIKWWTHWVKDNPVLSIYIGVVKGIILGILACNIFN